jgi:V/A-type H+/Na+-transporting ATPase subunit I
MIVPMKKIALVILEKERRDVLTKLRRLGVVHLDEIQGGSEHLAQLRESAAKLEKAESVLTEIKGVPVSLQSASENDVGEVIALAETVNNLADEKKACFDRIRTDTAEIARFEKWGPVTPDDFTFLSQKGVFVSLYEIPTDIYSKISVNVQTILVSKDKTVTRFLLVSSHQLATGERPEGLPQEAFHVPLPQYATGAMLQSAAAHTARIGEIDHELALAKKKIGAFAHAKMALLKESELENVYSGMGFEQPDDADATPRLAWISGFVPEDAVAAIRKTAKTENWALIIRDPFDDESVPTKLHNNKLVSLIYPLTDFLGTVPGYHEFDISGWFLLFFTIFFGMIFGDAGYGLLMVAGTLAMMVTAKKSGKPVSSAFWLILLLSMSTVAWGTVTCTWFGLSLDQIPSWLKAASVPPLSSAYTTQFDGVHSLFTTDQNLQIFCFTLALLQLSVAHIKCFMRDLKSLKCIGDLGALFMLWGMYYVVLMLVVSGTVFGIDTVAAGIPVGKTAVGLLAGGFLFSFIFSNYDGNIGKSILESLKNIISVILGVVNVFSDIVSYIRLWAVALAGSAISGTVNQMAGPMWGHAALFLAFVILLVFGHGLNMILNVLSVIVHGVRLNTLEFSSHLGMAWSGYKYQPFSETVKN